LPEVGSTRALEALELPELFDLLKGEGA